MFISPLRIEVLKGGKYQLLSPLGFKDGNILITVQKGFIYDGASIPRSLWSVVGCPMDYAYESCLHDALYASKIFNRKECDKYLYKAMKARGVSLITAKEIYLGVRFGGEEHFGSDSIADAREFVGVEWL